ncbi:CheR family methyltransferase [Salinisphaera sp. RV14]|uniref:CheR family methyltransferase n=1 Tax=Salinisphaera sp. RV14 TaxID=3454140 RepID=UPI003F85460D
MDNVPSGAATTTPIVAIGASAGGLRQISTLLGGIPAGTGAAFVVLQHLSSRHTSQLPSLLGRATALPVVTIEDRMTVTPDHVYVMPEGCALGIEGAQLRLLPKNQEPAPTVIDGFLRALAQEQGSRAVGVILSGSGQDGALGLKAIKLHGGLALAQDPETAEFGHMPRAAMELASPDYVLETRALIEPLCNHLRHNIKMPPLPPGATGTDNHRPRPGDTGPPDIEIGDRILHQALDLLRRNENRRDFFPYKPNMLKRRIRRRMGLLGARDPQAYLARLEKDASERANLTQDFLISVTDFFRDTAAYDALRCDGLSALLKDRDAADTIRAWVPGCATGEEAYSIAFALDEAIRETGREYNFIVFASDIDTRALAQARAGVYPESISADLTQRQLRTYFDKIDDHYRVKRGLREMVVFAAQNMIEDPPYSRLDLISCRNLLMYLAPETQQRVIATFHFALKPNGLLFLGSSETVAGQVDLFEPLDAASRLFKRATTQYASRADLPFAPGAGPGRSGDEPRTPRQSTAPHDDAQELARSILLREFVPACVLINRKLDILCSYGPTRDFLTLPFGPSSLSLMDMVREEYRSHLRAIIHRAFRDDSQCDVTAVPHDDDDYAVRITARPLHRPASARGLLFVTFERLKTAARTKPGATSDHEQQQLADELEATRNELNTTIQALEASNEDLKGSNEEILSMNEELQSTNEELETSKEELQSVNEELTTVNTELENKVAELETAHNDLENLFAGTNVATLFLDKALCIKRFTPAIKGLLSLITSDIGRPLSDISLKFDDPALAADAENVMRELSQREREVQTRHGEWFLRRIVPYRTQDNAINGVVITFADITEIKQASLASAESEQRLDLAMGAINGGMWDMALDPMTQDAQPDHIYISDRLKHLLGFEPEQFPNSLQAWEERVIAPDRERFSAIDRRVARGDGGLHYRIRHRDGNIRWFASNGTVIRDDENRPVRWIGIERDITEQKLAHLYVVQAQARLESLADSIPQMVAYADASETFHFANQAFSALFGHTPQDITGHKLEQIFGPATYAELRPCLAAAMAGREATSHVTHTDTAGRVHGFTVSLIPQFSHDRVSDDTAPELCLLLRENEADGRRAFDHIDRQASLVYMQRLATLGELTTTLVHDIKQPLNSINNYAGAIKRMLHAGRPIDQVTPTLGKIAEQVQHASEIVTVTRDFVGDRETSNSDLNTLIHQALALVESLVRKNHIDTHLDLYSPLPAIQCTPIQIEQVIINLIVNAVDAMESVDRGRRNLTIRTRLVDDEVEFGLTDSGEGIPRQKLGRIFDSFYTSKLEGTGLGLSLARSIVEGHGGRIWAESTLDHGATFFVRLPTCAVEGKLG